MCNCPSAGKSFFRVKPPRRHSLVLPAAFHVLLIIHLACVHRKSVLLSLFGVCVCVCEFVCLKGRPFKGGEPWSPRIITVLMSCSAVCRDVRFQGRTSASSCCTFACFHTSMFQMCLPAALAYVPFAFSFLSRSHGTPGEPGAGGQSCSVSFFAF